MVSMYCHASHAPAQDALHHPQDLCADCAALLDYASDRIDACRFGEHKPTCARCAVHCFRAGERDRIRSVMRYAGPRMTLRHPYLAVRHLMDRRRPTDRPSHR